MLAGLKRRRSTSGVNRIRTRPRASVVRITSAFHSSGRVGHCLRACGRRACALWHPRQCQPRLPNGYWIGLEFGSDGCVHPSSDRIESRRPETHCRAHIDVHDDDRLVAVGDDQSKSASALPAVRSSSSLYGVLWCIRHLRSKEKPARWVVRSTYRVADEVKVRCRRRTRESSIAVAQRCAG